MMFKNRIINGAMQIDQRNAGASVTINAASNIYVVDRWRGFGQAADGVFTLQKDTVSPSGFINSLKATVTTADASIGSTQAYFISQAIEGFNVADLGWGTSEAQTITMSFWVRSSLTGTFGGSLRNSSVTRSYPFSYTISSANTWEQKSVTITGDTTGTWETDAFTGIILTFSLGVGTDRAGTAGAWNANNNTGATGQTQVISTSGATFYITGVQLEKGSTATSFDYRPYGTELALCQRYYYKNKADSTNSTFGTGFNDSTTLAFSVLSFPVPMRVAPSALEQTGTASHYRIRTSGEVNTNCSSVPAYIGSTKESAWTSYTVASGLTAGQGCVARANNTAAFLAWSAEL